MNKKTNKPAVVRPFGHGTKILCKCLKIMKDFSDLSDVAAGRSMYWCPKCGRLRFEDVLQNVGWHEPYLIKLKRPK